MLHVFQTFPEANTFWTAPENARKPLVARRTREGYVIAEEPADFVGHPSTQEFPK